MKNILITTDFSAHSKNSVNYVLNFVQETQIPCKILLLNTYLVPHVDAAEIIMANDGAKMISRAGLELELYEAKKIVTNQNIKIETASRIGSLKNVIRQILKAQKFDLVAMGKDGGRHVETITELLKEQKCPLLVTYSD